MTITHDGRKRTSNKRLIKWVDEIAALCKPWWIYWCDQIASRIVQLGGEPNLSPEGLLTRSHSEYVEGDRLSR
ncbi:MAG: hypothetical protein ACHBNF_03340 [Chromatiales bacterium]